MKRLLFIATVIAALSGTARAQSAAPAPKPDTGRFWGYGVFTALFSPEVSFTVMPGYRNEFYRDPGSKLDSYMYELFTGPNITKKVGDKLTLKASLWYYYTGYDHQKTAWGATDAYVYQHSIEVVPSAEYRIGRFSIYDRLIFHQPVFSSVYSGNSNKWGYCLIMRELLQVRFEVNKMFGLIIADEPFFGLIEDGDTSKLVNAAGAKVGYNPNGYWKTGFRMNRFYAGFDAKVYPGLTITPSYVLEHFMSPTADTTLATTNHYFYLVVSYGLKLF